MCILEMAFIKYFEVKDDVQKGTLRFKENVDNKFVSFIQYMFSSIFVIW